MKTILSIFIVFIFGSVAWAQNSFQQELFSAQLALKYRAEIGLSEQQMSLIQDTYKVHITEFEIMRFDLDAELVALDKIMNADKVDEEKAVAQMQKVLQLEERLKRVRLLMLIRIKNALTKDQQERLKELRTENDIDGFLMTTPINDKQKVTFQLRGNIPGAPQPLYILQSKGEEREVSKAYMQSIDMSDIESITILKGQSATGKYGNKGENGVVFITVKNKE